MIGCVVAPASGATGSPVTAVLIAIAVVIVLSLTIVQPGQTRVVLRDLRG